MPSLYRDVGALRLPLLTTGVRDLAPLDPARDIMLALFASAIADELQPVWEAACAGTKLANAESPVRRRYPWAPDPKLLTQTETKFPALYVYRHETPVTIEPFTLWQRRVRGRWGVDYFLGALDIGAHGRLSDILIAVGKIVDQVIEDGGHDSYESGARALGNVGLGTCGFSTVELIDFRAGGARFADGDKPGPTYLACSITLETTEFAKPRDGSAADFLGASFVFGTGNIEGIVPDMVAATTDETP